MSGYWYLAIPIIIAVLALARFVDHRHDSEWNFDPTRQGLRMRRKVNGRWEYRPATAAEELDWLDRNAW